MEWPSVFFLLESETSGVELAVSYAWYLSTEIE
jgi:hypothetical protein